METERGGAGLRLAMAAGTKAGRRGLHLHALLRSLMPPMSTNATSRPLDDAERAARMRRIRKRDTKPELLVRRMAHALGFRFRLYRRDLPGSPDLVFPRLRKIVFVHGCFWHRHEGCRLARLPRSRPDYWIPKLTRNVQRDRRAQAELEREGWQVLTIWECELADLEAVRERLRLFLADQSLGA